MPVAVYYQTFRPIVLDPISVSLTDIPVLHTVGTRRIVRGKLRTWFSLSHKCNVKYKHVYIML